MIRYGTRIVPAFVNSGKHERLVDPSSLTAHQKQALWFGIKIDNPALADALKTDPNIEALKQVFDARIQFSVEDSNHYVKTGLKKLEENN